MLAIANKFAFELIKHKLKEVRIMTIKHVNGNLFKIAKETDYLAHCISKDYALGAGIAIEFQRRFQLREKLKYTDKRPGIGYNVTIGRVFNLITKEKCWQKPTYESLENALISMRDHCLQYNITEIVMPRIGCGLDRLAWPEVLNTITRVFTDTEYNITICHL